MYVSRTKDTTTVWLDSEAESFAELARLRTEYPAVQFNAIYPKPIGVVHIRVESDDIQRWLDMDKFERNIEAHRIAFGEHTCVPLSEVVATLRSSNVRGAPAVHGLAPMIAAITGYAAVKDCCTGDLVMSHVEPMVSWGNDSITIYSEDREVFMIVPGPAIIPINILPVVYDYFTADSQIASIGNALFIYYQAAANASAAVASSTHYATAESNDVRYNYVWGDMH